MAYFGGTQVRRMRPVTLTSAMMVLVCAVFAGYTVMLLSRKPAAPQVIVQEVVKEVPAPPPPAPATMRVLLPRNNILPGQKLDPSMFASETRPLIPGMEEKTVCDGSEVAGMFAGTYISAGLPLLKRQLTFEGPPNDITSQIPDGHRAVAIPVNSESGVEGWARPGVRVDVVWSTMLREKPIATTIVTNAYVLSADRATTSTQASVDKSAAAPVQFVTLMVAAVDAQKIQLAKRAGGALSLSLRGDSDKAERVSNTISVDNLLRQSDWASLEGVGGSVTVDGRRYELRGKTLRPAAGAEDPHAAFPWKQVKIAGGGQ